MLETEMEKDPINSTVLDFIKECKKTNFNERKRLCKNSKILLNY